MSMRYQRVSSPDCVPLSSGKKSNINGRILHTTTNIPGARTNVSGTGCSALEGKGFRFRSPSITHDQNNLEAAPASPHSENHHHDSPPPPPPPPPPAAAAAAKNHRHDRSPSPSASASPSPSPSRVGGGGGGSGDMLLQWGQRKRARVSRSEIRALTDDSSSSSSSVAIKAQRRLAPAASTMPPPPPPPPPLPNPCTYTSTSNATTRPRREASAFLSHRNLDERSGSGGSGSPSRNGGNGSRVVSRSTAGKRSPPPEKVDRKMITCSGSVKDEKANGSSDRTNHVDSGNQAHSELEAGPTNTAAPLAGGGGGEKVNVELTEWPRIFIALSRKEKEDDFLAMKGTKLSQRPKKRAKNIDKALQYCFPGMWLSDLTRNRYEVREKKCVKKQKRRGLKGMESLESDSE
ncbi:enhancer of mRNA-decapping protein 1 isoform X2 [Corylus avellana]|uniref:enhancer of mRNA-decapping protein 1 isoform X2 n=1 Tax=Corylus avellana TaxID=13451 RepID=UPI00286CAD63|nr:enhancer of mRNA-decapping protein 1 isoform X2 [Corylus avellana]